MRQAYNAYWAGSCLGILVEGVVRGVHSGYWGSMFIGFAILIPGWSLTKWAIGGISDDTKKSD